MNVTDNSTCDGKFMTKHNYTMSLICSIKILMNARRRLTIVIKKMVFVLTRWGVSVVRAKLDILEMVPAALVRESLLLYIMVPLSIPSKYFRH